MDVVNKAFKKIQTFAFRPAFCCLSGITPCSNEFQFPVYTQSGLSTKGEFFVYTHDGHTSYGAFRVPAISSSNISSRWYFKHALNFQACMQKLLMRSWLSHCQKRLTAEFGSVTHLLFRWISVPTMWLKYNNLVLISGNSMIIPSGLSLNNGTK